jgi:hypothetical protein
MAHLDCSSLAWTGITWAPSRHNDACIPARPPPRGGPWRGSPRGGGWRQQEGLIVLPLQPAQVAWVYRLPQSANDEAVERELRLEDVHRQQLAGAYPFQQGCWSIDHTLSAQRQSKARSQWPTRRPPVRATDTWNALLHAYVFSPMLNCRVANAQEPCCRYLSAGGRACWLDSGYPHYSQPGDNFSVICGPDNEPRQIATAEGGGFSFP